MIAASSPRPRRAGEELSTSLPRDQAGERGLTLALGAGLIVAGAVRATWGGLALAACGAVLMWHSAPRKPQAPPLPKAELAVADTDEVAEASDESFPASDPPSWTSSSFARGRR
jgi:uncharacterized membrane protein